MSMQYAFDLEATQWLRVPLAFPDGEDADVFTWAARVADERAHGREDLRRAIIGRATEVAAVLGPREAAAERLWLLPSPQAPEAIAHLYFADAAGEPAEAFVLAGAEGGAQAVRSIEGTGCDEALAAELLVETEQGMLAISRRIARMDGTIALIEVIDAAPTPVAAEDGPLDQLLRGLVLRPAAG